MFLTEHLLPVCTHEHRLLTFCLVIKLETHLIRYQSVFDKCVVEVNMKFYLTNRQLVEVDEAVGPVLNWEERSQVNCGGVKNFEQMWAVKCTPEIIPHGIPLSDALALNKKILSKIEG